jgi:hypothetical protein
MWEIEALKGIVIVADGKERRALHRLPKSSHLLSTRMTVALNITYSFATDDVSLRG